MDWLIILAIAIILAVVTFSPGKEHYQTVRFTEPLKETKADPVTNYEAALPITRPIPAELLPKPCIDPEDYTRGPMLPTPSNTCGKESEIMRRSNGLYYSGFQGKEKESDAEPLSVGQVYDAMTDDFRHVVGSYESVQGAQDDKYNKFAL